MINERVTKAKEAGERKKMVNGERREVGEGSEQQKEQKRGKQPLVSYSIFWVSQLCSATSCPLPLRERRGMAWNNFSPFEIDQVSNSLIQLLWTVLIYLNPVIEMYN